MPSKIEWTDETWNPVRGCSRVSEGCRNCYAEREANRQRSGAYKGLVRIKNGRPSWTGEVRLVPEKLNEPVHWIAPRRIFVNSMSDLFHESLPDEAIDRVFAVMALCPQHRFQILTKRAARMWSYLSDLSPGSHRVMAIRTSTPDYLMFAQDKTSAIRFPLPNVWLGVSVEDQTSTDERIPLLLQTPAVVRFVSYEPALAAVDLRWWLFPETLTDAAWFCAAGFVATRGLDWVIAGGESGPGARPAPPEWFRSVRDQCQHAGVPFFFKQWGEWSPGLIGGGLHKDNYNPRAVRMYTDARRLADVPVGDGTFHRMARVGKALAGRRLDGQYWSQFPDATGRP